ncbi:helix-turn-helix domain-containing protein [Paenibacillus sp. Lou8.1]|uniref:helix-turn-helix transcriptional regulator n=1 Tax=Paenibacillus sp. Lou8.1 TaxID=2962041 RepID=UPI0020B706D1|nr:helix-turn-helix domain-containing protein [Paenibacillus sp. Lou8.1]MCP3810028.1 helix-turn-helix domain-containing protein [Paenibacillus sp. Lou8.1]
MLNNKLREFRKRRGMSVAELARRAKTTRQTITSIELHGQEPSGSLLILISEVLEKDPREIFFNRLVTHVEQNEKSA